MSRFSGLDEDFSPLTPDEEKDLQNMIVTSDLHREGIYEKMNRIIDHKSSHHYTSHDPIPKEVVEDEPAIAYLIEDKTVDYSVSFLMYWLSLDLSGKTLSFSWVMWSSKCWEEHSVKCTYRRKGVCGE